MKIAIAYIDDLSDSLLKTEIFDGLNGADLKFIDQSSNDGEYGVAVVQLMTQTERWFSTIHRFFTP